MTEKHFYQPHLSKEQDSFTRIGTTHDYRNRTVFKITAVASLLATAELLSVGYGSDVVSAQNETSTSTPDAESPLSRSMEGYPRSVRFTTIHGTLVNYRFNWNTATALNGTTGAILEPGLYEERPRPIDPSIMNTPSDTTHNGVLPEWNYMSGQVAMIDSGFVYLVVPLRHLDEMGLPLADQPATPRFGIFELSYPKNSNNICRPVDENGTLIPLPTGVIGDGANGVQLGNSVRSPEPMNGYNDMTAIMLAADGRSFTVPTVNGPITVEAGTMMAVEYASNAVAINPSYGSDNNGRTPDQMIAAYMDDTLHLGAWGGDRAMLLVNDVIFAAP